MESIYDDDEDRKECRIFNFPVQMLSGIFENKTKVIGEIAHYSVYKYSTQSTLYSELARFQEAAEHLRVDFQNEEGAVMHGKELVQSTPDKCINVGLNARIFHEFALSHKTEFELACFCAFCAIKSWIGTKNYIKVCRNGILRRMFWNDTESELYKKYSTRYHFDKLITELEVGNWHLKRNTGKSRGYYLSFKLSCEELTYIAKSKQKTSKIKELKEIKKQVLQKVQKRIKAN